MNEEAKKILGIQTSAWDQLKADYKEKFGEMPPLAMMPPGDHEAMIKAAIENDDPIKIEDDGERLY